MLHLCRLRTVHCRPIVVETLQYWPHTLVRLIPRVFHYLKDQPCTESGEMARVVCTHPVNLLGAAQGGGVLCSQVVLDPFMF